jgi:hypothetical protein
MTMTKVSITLVSLIAAIVLLVAFVIWSDNNHTKQIKTWAESHNYRVENITRWHMSSLFWFWRRKGDDILQADLIRDGRSRVSYFRISLWGLSQKWEDGSTDDE